MVVTVVVSMVTVAMNQVGEGEGVVVTLADPHSRTVAVVYRSPAVRLRNEIGQIIKEEMNRNN